MKKYTPIGHKYYGNFHYKKKLWSTIFLSRNIHYSQKFPKKLIPRKFHPRVHFVSSAIQLSAFPTNFAIINSTFRVQHLEVIRKVSVLMTPQSRPLPRTPTFASWLFPSDVKQTVKQEVWFGKRKLMFVEILISCYMPKHLLPGKREMKWTETSDS